MVRFRRRVPFVVIVVLLLIGVTPVKTFAVDFPAPPPNFTVTVVNYNSLTLRWDPVDYAITYTYVVSTSPDAPAPPRASFYDYTAVTVTGLTPGTTYYCRVCAWRLYVDGYGYERSNWSPIVSAVPTTQTPKNLSATSTGYNSLRVGWTPVAGVTGYQIKWKTGLGTWSAPINVATNYYNHAGLVCGTTYSYQVCAYTGTNYSVWSGTASGTPIPATSSGGSVYSKEYDTLHLSWHAVDGADGYQVQRKLGVSSPWPDPPYLTATGTTSYDDNGLLTGATYYYRVRAYRILNKTDKVYGNWSDSFSGVPVPASPAWLSVKSQGFDALQLNWAAVSGADGYFIQKATSSGGPWTTLSNPVAAPPFTDNTLQTGKTYFYKVCAYHIESKTEKIIGPWSVASSGVPVPAKPAGLAVMPIDYDSLGLSWTAVTGAEGYVVERAASSDGPWKEAVRTEKTLFTDNNLPAATMFYYRVKAYLSGIYGSYCTPASGSTAWITPTTSGTAPPVSPPISPVPSESSTDSTTANTAPTGITPTSEGTGMTTKANPSESVTESTPSTGQSTSSGQNPHSSSTAAASTSASDGPGDNSGNPPFSWLVLILAVVAGAGAGIGVLSLVISKRRPK